MSNESEPIDRRQYLANHGIPEININEIIEIDDFVDSIRCKPCTEVYLIIIETFVNKYPNLTFENYYFRYKVNNMFFAWDLIGRKKSYV